MQVRVAQGTWALNAAMCRPARLGGEALCQAPGVCILSVRDAVKARVFSWSCAA